MPPRGWIRGWRQRDWLRAAVASLSSTLVTILFLAIALHLGEAFSLDAHDFIVEITHQLLGFSLWSHWSVLARVIVPIDITITRNYARFQLLVVHPGLVAAVWLREREFTPIQIRIIF